MPVTSLSIIVPVFNEEAILENSISNKVQLLKTLSLPYEVIVVNDASTDGSVTIVEKLMSHNHYLKLLSNKKNEGFGGAMINGIQNAEGKYIICLPADLDPSITDIEKILLALETHQVIACYRINKPGNSSASIIGSTIYQEFVRFLFGLKLKDINWVHAFRSEVFTTYQVKPKNKRIFFLAETLIKCNWLRLSIGELNLEPTERLNKKGASQSFKTFLLAMRDLFIFYVRSLLRGKRADL